MGEGEASAQSKHTVSWSFLYHSRAPGTRMLKHWEFWDFLIIFRDKHTGSFIQPIVLEQPLRAMHQMPGCKFPRS